jgi:hypothetical protein
MVQQAIQDGRRDDRIAEDLAPGVSSPVKETVPKENFRRFGEPETRMGASHPTCHEGAPRCTPTSTPL